MISHRGLFVASILCLATLTWCAGFSIAQQTEKKAAKKAPNPAFATIQDEPGLPRVLLIGDSISIGYTVSVREMLKGKANVHRIPTNGGPTINGLANIDKWLGDSKWDVIHFNWGLHDLKMMDGKHQVPLEEYTTNMRKLVERLKQTKAKLIWCNTTPVPAMSNPPRSNGDVLAYNVAAKKIMDENHIVIDDLYAFAHERIDKIQLPNNVHFSPEGSKVLAEKVTQSILAELGKK